MFYGKLMEAMAAINLTNLLFLDVIYETSFMMVNSAVWTITAIIVVLLKKDIFIASQK